MNKLAFSTLGAPDWTFDEVLTNAHAMGFSGLEIRGINGIMEADRIPEFFPENAAETLRRVRKHGLRLIGFGSSVHFHEADKSDAMLDTARREIAVCARMGIPNYRVFGDAFPEGEPESAVIARVAEGLHRICPFAYENGVTVLLEVHGAFNTPERIQAVCAACGQLPGFGILWDIEHTDKTCGDGFAAFAGPVLPFIRHIHVKDHHRENGAFRLCRVGQGDIPIRAIVRYLRDNGYDGWYSLEWEKKWHPELPDASEAFPEYIALMQSIL